MMPWRVMRTGWASTAAERGKAKLGLDPYLALVASLLFVALEQAPASPSTAEHAQDHAAHLAPDDWASSHAWASSGALDVAAEAEEPRDTLDERPAASAAALLCCRARFPEPLWSVVVEPTWRSGVTHRRGVVGLGRGPPLA